MRPLPERGQNNTIRNIRRVVVLGGTHGNERTGVHVAQYIRNHVDEFLTGNITEVETLFGNLKAIERNSRYMDVDLNRSFTYDYSQLQKPEVSQSDFYEVNRALEIRKKLGAMETPVDFLIDLHTTTANMKNCFIVSDKDPWTLALCADLLKKVPDSTVVLENVPRALEKTSSSLGLNHITLEVGPVQQGVADFGKISDVIQIVKEIIKSVDGLNGQKIDSAIALPRCYSPLPYKIDYPRDAQGFPTAVIHKDFMHSDYRSLNIGDPVFTTIEGGAIFFGEGDNFPEELVKRVKDGQKICPVFIGEAAYIDKGQAFIATLGV